MPKTIALLILLSLAVTGCGTHSLPPIVDNGKVDEEQKHQQQIIIHDYVERLGRTDRVAYAILTTNVELCGDAVGYSPGMVVKTRSDVYRPLRDATAYFLGMDARPRVVSVVPGGPADKAGIKAGDVIAAVNSKASTDADDAFDAAAKGAPVELTLDRAGEKIPARLQPVKVCAYPVRVFEDPTINAMATGTGIWMLIGMVKFCKTDDELALVIGHELAHNTMQHMQAKRNNSLLGALLLDMPVVLLTGMNPGVGGNLGSSLYSQDFETEADYVGMYHSARAGYDITGVADLWRRMGAEHPEAVTLASSHPTTARRFVALEAARDEIKAKIAAGKGLKPEMKPEK